MQLDGVHKDPAKKHDFLFMFDVKDGNVNGDPDAGNLQRTDPETMQGLASDVSLKRKVRNFAAIAATEEPADKRLNLFVEHHGVLNDKIREAHRALGHPVGKEVTSKLPTKNKGGDEVAAEIRSLTLPDGFLFSEKEGALQSDGTLTVAETEDQLAERNPESYLSETASKLFRKAAHEATTKVSGIGAPQMNAACRWMAQTFVDVRLFGGTMGTGLKADEVWGPVQLTWGRSIDPVLPQSIALTRMAIAAPDPNRPEKRTEMGEKSLIHYGLFIAHGFYSPYRGEATGVMESDLELLWEALAEGMWEFDRSSSRGEVSGRGLYVFTHERKRGNAPAHKLFDLVKVSREENVETPRNFSDYRVSVDRENLPQGVTLGEA